jgi:phage tail-like protein
MSVLFCLGHDLSGFFALLAPGDYVEIAQTGTTTGFDILTFTPRTRAPVVPPPAGYSWIASVRIDSVTVSQRTIEGTTPQDWEQWAIDISKLAPGNHAIAFRLTIDGPPLPGPPDSPLFELEIPAFYLDALAFAAVTGPVAINQIPDPGPGTPPPTNTAIDFDFVDFGTDGIDETTINVTVDPGTGAEDAIIAGVFQAGYSGTISTVAQTTHVHIVRATRFPSAATVTVSAEAQTNTSANPLSPDPTVWVFTVIDDVAPVLIGASGESTTRVRVTFSEAVLASSTTGEHDALNPDRFSILPTVPIGGTIPAVTPTVIEVLEISSSQFDLVTDIDLTPGVLYAVTADAVQDPAGNFTLTIFDFVSFIPPKPLGRDWDLYRKLPLKNRQDDARGSQDLLRFVSCLQDVVDLLLYDIDRWPDILDIDLADEDFIDAILAGLGNPFPFVLSLTDKRRLAYLLVPIYRKKGTPDGIVDAIRFFLALECEITTFTGDGFVVLGVSQLGVDWVLGPGTSYARYSFRVVAPIILSADQFDKIKKIAVYMRPAHTHLIEIVQPFPPPVYDPVELGTSKLGVDWILH